MVRSNRFVNMGKIDKLYINTPQLAARVKRKGQIRLDIVTG